MIHGEHVKVVFGSSHLFLLLIIFVIIVTELSALPKDVSREFFRAREIVPELVKIESKISTFLRYENNDPKKAAQRLATYWKYRKECFKDRWMLPLNQTGTGALTMDDIEILRSGYITPVPLHPTGTVCLYDESRLVGFSKGVNSRIAFYLSAIFADDPVRSSRVIVLHVVHSGSGSKPDTGLSDEYWDVYRVALPFKVTRVIIGQAFEDGKQELIEYLGYASQRMVEFRSGGQASPNRFVSHSSAGIRRQLENEGINRRAIPHCLGGDFEYGKFANWIRMRISVEDIMSSAPSVLNRITPVGKAMAVGQRLLLTDGRAKRKKDTTTTTISEGGSDDEKLSGKDLLRKRNAIYSRRLYHKRKMEIASLEGQCAVWRDKNRKLRMDNARLESLIVEATRVVLEFVGQEQASFPILHAENNRQSLQPMNMMPENQPLLNDDTMKFSFIWFDQDMFNSL